MTAPAKPLTADEIAAIKAADMPMFTREEGLRLIATIEQQAEQIEKLRETVSDVRITLTVDGRYPTMVERCDKVLASTEPVNDKR